MEHCYCYDFTNKSSRVPSQSCKLFKVRIKDFGNFDDFCIRSVIDSGSSEFKLMLEGFDERCKDVNTDKAWFKLIHLLFGFIGGFDVKGKIAKDIQRHLKTYCYYADTAKRALSSYIELLRTGEYNKYENVEFYKDMSVDDLVDLLEKELRHRTTVYRNKKSPGVLIFEITDYHYDYDALYEKYGIIGPNDTSSDSYNDFIAYITTSEETRRLKNQQAMYAQMYYGEQQNYTTQYCYDGHIEIQWIFIKQATALIKSRSHSTNHQHTMLEKIIKGIKYRLDEETMTAEVIAKRNGYEGDIIIPEIVVLNDATYRVTTIGARAFQTCTLLTSITIPNSVTAIEAWAFADCRSLTSIAIPDSVTSVGGGTFSGCSKLTSIAIPDSVTSIGGGVFFDCTSLISITLPNSVKSIRDMAFYDCRSLTSITIPNSVTSIGERAFEGCKSLTTITIPNSVNMIGDYAFIGCSSLTAITIPDSVTIIGEGAFYHCSSLASIAIPNSVITIGKGAFSTCSSLISITIPDSVTSIGKGAFAGCERLTSIVVAEGNTMYDSRQNCHAIIQTDTDALVCGCQSTTIPDGVKSIEQWAFMDYKTLTSIIIPDSVTAIGNRAFEKCTSLTTITIPHNVTSIGHNAFYRCSSLTAIAIPNSVITVKKSAFNGCESLTSIIIGNRVTSIEDYAFDGCKKLTSITLPDSVTSVGECAFINCTKVRL